MGANQNFFWNGHCLNQSSKDPKHTWVMPSSQLVARCTWWGLENTAGHSPQLKNNKQQRNTSKPERWALNFNHNEARAQTKIT
jgi:hypothetical protein